MCPFRKRNLEAWGLDRSTYGFLGENGSHAETCLSLLTFRLDPTRGLHALFRRNMNQGSGSDKVDNLEGLSVCAWGDQYFYFRVPLTANCGRSNSRAGGMARAPVSAPSRTGQQCTTGDISAYTVMQSRYLEKWSPKPATRALRACLTLFPVYRGRVACLLQKVAVEIMRP